MARPHWVQQTDEEGRAHFGGLPAGPYRATIVSSRSHGRLLPTQWRFVPVRADCVLAVGASQVLPLSAPAPRDVTLVVRDEDENPRDGVRIRLTPNPGGYASQVRGHRRGASTRTEASGRTTVSLYPGAYAMELRAGDQTRSTWLHVKREGTATYEVALPRAARRVEGRLVDADTGAPIPNRRVELTNPDSEAYETLGQGGTDADGRFSIVGVPAARVSLRLITNLDANRTALADNPYGNGSRTLDLVDADATGLEIRLRKTADWLEAAGSVKVSVLARDAETQRGIRRGFVTVSVELGDVWIQAAYGRIGEGGRTTAPIAVPRGHALRVEVQGGFEADPPYAARRVDVTPEGDALDLEVDLARVRDG